MNTPIFNAASLRIDQAVSAMPTMRSTLLGWFRPLGLAKVIKKTVGVRVVEVEQPIEASGTWQPFTFEELAIKPEGQRSWRWFMVHTTPDIVLQTDDRITRNGEKFVVMAKGDYTDQAFVEYHVVNAYDLPGGGQ